jgi:hypothetical protein
MALVVPYAKRNRVISPTANKASASTLTNVLQLDALRGLMPPPHARQCTVICSPGYADCNHDLQKDACEVDVNADIFNCGKCGPQCPKPVRSGVEATCRYFSSPIINGSRLNQF